MPLLPAARLLALLSLVGGCTASPPPAPRAMTVPAERPPPPPPPPATPGSGTPAPFVLLGQLDLDDPAVLAAPIRLGLNKELAEFTHCASEALAVNPELDGTVKLGWNILYGPVRDVHVLDNTTGSPALALCFVMTMRMLRFDPTIWVGVESASWTVSGAPTEGATQRDR